MILATPRPRGKPCRHAARRFARLCALAGLMLSLAAFAPAPAHAGTESAGSPPPAQKK